jgi:hypothetical protein
MHLSDEIHQKLLRVFCNGELLQVNAGDVTQRSHRAIPDSEETR